MDERLRNDDVDDAEESERDDRPFRLLGSERLYGEFLPVGCFRPLAPSQWYSELLLPLTLPADFLILETPRP